MKRARRNQHRRPTSLLTVASTMVGVLLSAFAVGAQAVAPPSSSFKTYVEGELIRVSIPSNWRELPAANAVTFAPDGAFGNAGVKSVFTHGVSMGLARNDRRNLRATTDGFIESYVLVKASARRAFRYSNITIGDRPGLHAVLSSMSEATGEPERIEIYTTLLADGTLFYVLAVVPRDHASAYDATFRRVVGSIQIMDGTGPCVGEQTSRCHQ